MFSTCEVRCIIVFGENIYKKKGKKEGEVL